MKAGSIYMYLSREKALGTNLEDLELIVTPRGFEVLNTKVAERLEDGTICVKLDQHPGDAIQ